MREIFRAIPRGTGIFSWIACSTICVLRAIAMTEEKLPCRCFEVHLGRPVAAGLAHYCRAAGFADESSLRRAILREYCYTRFQQETAPGSANW